MATKTKNIRQFKARMLFALCAVILLGFVLSQLYHSRLQTLSVAESALESSMLVSEHALIASVSTINVSLQDIANDIHEHPELLMNYSHSELMLHHKSLNEITSAELRIVDANGDLRAVTDQMKNVNLSEREFFKKLRESTTDELYISEILPSKVRVGWTLIFARKITGRDGKFQGVVLASMAPSFFAHFAEKLKIGPDDLFSIVTGDPLKFAFRMPKTDEYYGRDFKFNPALTPVVTGQRHQAIYDVYSYADEIRRWVGVTWAGKYPILIVIGKHRGDILRAWVIECVSYLILVAFVISLGFITLERILRSSEQISNHQAQLASSAKLVALGEMAASVAHEINNPLAIIKGKTEMLKEKIEMLELGVDSSGALVRDIDRIDFTVDRISKIVKGLRSFSRNAENDPFVERDARLIVEETVELCRERFKANHTTLKLTDLREVFVSTRSSQLSQVMLNLLNNAYDAVESLDERWVEIKMSSTAEEVVIAIIDSGAGIPKQIESRMVEPFFSTKPVGRGTGLGLSISMGIIDMHGGSLKYELSGAHTSFVIRLPRASGEARSAA